ncbi:MAG: hypothetical protein MJ252_26820 [archaeon]|nr:hypothetical protein [archaeon]
MKSKSNEIKNKEDINSKTIKKKVFTGNINSEGHSLKKEVPSFRITLRKAEENLKMGNSNKANDYLLKIQPWASIKQLKSRISEVIGISKRNMQLRLFYKNQELSEKLSINDYKIEEEKNPVVYYQKFVLDKNYYIKVFANFHCHQMLRKHIQEVEDAFANNIFPKKVVDGTSGTYFMLNLKKEKIAVFKPFDEEAYAPNNPKNYKGQFGSPSFREGVLSGEGIIREYAAYILDVKNIFNVPQTTIVEVAHSFFNKTTNLMDQSSIVNSEFVHNFLLEDSTVNITEKNMDQVQIKKMIKKRSIDKTGINEKDYLQFDSEEDSGEEEDDKATNDIFKPRYRFITKKYGSFQRFIKNTEIAANYSFSLYTKDDVHKIAILDMRICNCDRNEENILVKRLRNKETKKDYYALYPIDHSLSFPDCLNIYDYELCWTGWDQISEPLSEDLVKYIKSIDILGDMKYLSNSIKLRENCWKIFRVCNTTLKVGVENGLNLLEIANMLYKVEYGNDAHSVVEDIIKKTDSLCNQMKIDTKLNSLLNQMNIDEGKVIQRTEKRRGTGIKRSTSEPNLKFLEDEETAPSVSELKNKITEINERKPKSKKKDQNKIIFDSPYNQMYFNYFEIFLLEHIRKKFPEKFTEKKEDEKETKESKESE